MGEAVGPAVQSRLEKAVKELRAQIPALDIREFEPMNLHCSFKSGGITGAYAVPEDMSSFRKVVSIIKSFSLIPFILGNGTNVVFPDEGTPRLIVLSTEKLQGIRLCEDGTIYAECGVSLSRLASFALENSLSGLEFASGIPGTVGGGIMMNAGAYGGELKDVTDSVEICRLSDLDICRMTNRQCNFGYRHSCFQDIPGCIILSAVFRLESGSRDAISSKMKELNQRRRDKQPLDLPSAGSVFRRPDGYYAAALIEECGLKGCTSGGAQVSEKHAGFIVNKGNASSDDFFRLVGFVRDSVYRQKGIKLTPEVIFLSPDCSSDDGLLFQNVSLSV